ncbi:DUF2288 domain-containing protein [Pseudanabaena sp. FACHB-2040]|uniref:DUF2288 domain-containing protein n=1 Tax=Pseudanabaena sp. FACHB-2040 TaxID=2692859 RepID=UPI001686D3F6|nr:DUF2288 domain-containing protein [Pseudanabaena sp. FACHB-2040]MBD2260910.1 DUF2288 family protein [Pseudanabaena sp. FACHB-2040]
MTQDLRSELAEMMGPAEWRWLSPHANKGSVVVVNPALDLVEVGYAIATDDVSTVDRWIAEALLTKPSPDQLNDWNQAQSKQFSSLIVQPFVLVQVLDA